MPGPSHSAPLSGRAPYYDAAGLACPSASASLVGDEEGGWPDGEWGRLALHRLLACLIAAYLALLGACLWVIGPDPAPGPPWDTWLPRPARPTPTPRLLFAVPPARPAQWLPPAPRQFAHWRPSHYVTPSLFHSGPSDVRPRYTLVADSDVEGVTSRNRTLRPQITLVRQFPAPSVGIKLLDRDGVVEYLYRFTKEEASSIRVVDGGDKSDGVVPIIIRRGAGTEGSAGKSGTGFKVVGEVAPEHRPALHPWSAENAPRMALQTEEKDAVQDVKPHATLNTSSADSPVKALPVPTTANAEEVHDTMVSALRGTLLANHSTKVEEMEVQVKVSLEEEVPREAAVAEAKEKKSRRNPRNYEVIAKTKDKDGQIASITFRFKSEKEMAREAKGDKQDVDEIVAAVAGAATTAAIAAQALATDAISLAGDVALGVADTVVSSLASGGALAGSASAGVAAAAVGAAAGAAGSGSLLAGSAASGAAAAAGAAGAAATAAGATTGAVGAAASGTAAAAAGSMAAGAAAAGVAGAAAAAASTAMAGGTAAGAVAAGTAAGTVAAGVAATGTAAATAAAGATGATAAAAGAAATVGSAAATGATATAGAVAGTAAAGVAGTGAGAGATAAAAAAATAAAAAAPSTAVVVPSAAFGVAGGLFALGSGSLRRDLLAGFASTIIAAALLYPLDTMKTRVQVGKRPTTKSGLRGLYKGIGLSLARKCPENAAYIAIASHTRRVILNNAHVEGMALTNLAYWWTLAAACGTTLAISLIKLPLELLNKNVQTGQSSGARDALRRLFSSPGTVPLLGFSWLAIMIRDMPKAIMQFTSTQALMRMQVLHCFGLSGFWQGVLYSALAAGLAALLTTPFDVLGSRIMTQLRSQIWVRKGQLVWSAQGMASAVSFEQMSSLDSLRNIMRQVYEEKGLKGFWTGALLRLAYHAPYRAIAYAIFQAILSLDAADSNK